MPRRNKIEFTCKGCGNKSYTKDKRRANYCTHECYSNNSNHYETRSFDHNCATCGERFTSKSNTSKYCNDECNPNNWQPFQYKKKCTICNNSFVTTRSNTHCCSDECIIQYQRDYALASAKNEHDLKYANIINQPKCKSCGERFIPEYGCKRRSTCSKNCAKEYQRELRKKYKLRRKALKRGANRSESISVSKVMKRDKFKCKLCGCKTPKRLRGTTEDNAPELDHVIPLSKGGNHTYNNVQILCRKCNITKSNNYAGQQPLQFR